jgi:mgtE-like transporter
VFTRPFHGFVARLRAAVDSDAAGLKQALAALLVSSAGDLLAGVTLGAISDTLALLPGLLVLVPAAIGMRGNIFGALGSRLGTSIHTGTFSLSRRRDTVVGQNVVASIALTLFVSAALAVLAKVVASAFGAGETISLADFLVISVVGGILGSVFVLGLTLVVAWMSVRRGWDMDNVAAPLVTAAGDMVTLPALYLATFLVGIKGVTVTIALATVVLAIGSLIWTVRLRLPIVQRILRESIPVLLVAGTVDLIAGLTIENRLESFLAYPALLVLVPPFLEDTGALGSVLSSRLASKLHLGIIDPTARPQRAARDDFAITAMLGIPVFVLVALSSQVAATLTGQASPGVLNMVGISLIGGFLATFFALFVAYYGSIATYRLGLDPDNYGVPLLTSSMDLVGALSLIVAIIILGIH